MLGISSIGVATNTLQHSAQTLSYRIGQTEDGCPYLPLFMVGLASRTSITLSALNTPKRSFTDALRSWNRVADLIPIVQECLEYAIPCEKGGFERFVHGRKRGAVLAGDALACHHIS